MAWADRWDLEVPETDRMVVWEYGRVDAKVFCVLGGARTTETKQPPGPNSAIGSHCQIGPVSPS